MIEAVGLALVSHTNVGKTTLARTLLRRDVGDVLDQAHVTELAGRHVLLDVEGAPSLVLIDTPGFGDSARLARLLADQEDPIGWLLAQRWDPVEDRPRWCCQAAARAVRTHADLVLYLVNASERPQEAGYVSPEMDVLERLGKPVLVLLNQTGPTRQPHEERAEVARWREWLEDRPLVRDVLRLDAFTRCWVQEATLLERVRDALPPERRTGFARILEEWRGRDLARHREALAVMSAELARAARDEEPVEEGGFGRRERQARRELEHRLRQGFERAFARWLELFGLEGRSRIELETAMADFDLDDTRIDPRRFSRIGAVVAGVAGGAWADLFTGGLSFGGGAVLGGITGWFGGQAAARAIRVVRGEGRARVVWSRPLLERATRELVLRYLAVSHFGRGRGAWREQDHPATWRRAVEAALEERRQELGGALVAARRDGSREQAEARLAPHLTALVRDVFVRFHGDEARWLPGA